MSPEMLTAHIAIARSKGVPCIVRCSGPDHYFIKWVLDAGADGIIVPQARSLYARPLPLPSTWTHPASPPDPPCPCSLIDQHAIAFMHETTEIAETAAGELRRGGTEGCGQLPLRPDRRARHRPHDPDAVRPA